MSADDQTSANFRNSVVAKTEVSGFVSWLQKRDELSQAEKERLATLAAEYQRGRGR